MSKLVERVLGKLKFISGSSGNVTIWDDEAKELLAHIEKLQKDSDTAWSTIIALADKLGIDPTEARKQAGKPSDVFMAYIERLNEEVASWQRVHHAEYKKREALDAEIERLEANQLPEGCVAVPKEPTEQMMRAMTDGFMCVNGDTGKTFKHGYQAMIKAQQADNG